MRWRTPVGGLAILCWIGLYSAAAAIVGAEHIPDHWITRLIYYAVAGIVWILPLRPMFRWMADDPQPEDYPFD